MMYRLTDRIRFGKHRGKTIEDVVANNPTYIEWMLDTIDSVKLDDEAMERYEVSINEYYQNDSHFPSPHWSDW